jgi:hypothetical protein
MARKLVLKDNGLLLGTPPNGYKSIGFVSGSFSVKDSNNIINQITGTGSSNNATLLPSSYGSVGDGVTDDTQALQDTFDAARLLKLPVCLNSTYLVSSTINVVDTIVVSNPGSKIISTNIDFVLEAEGTRSDRYPTISTENNPNGDVLRGYSTIAVTSSVISALDIQNGDLIKITSDRKFNPGSGENVLQGEIQRVLAADSLTGEIQIYGFFEDTYLASDGAELSKVYTGQFETVGTLQVEQNGATSSKGISLKYLDTPKVDFKVVNAIERSLSVIDCYSPKVYVDNYGANQTGLGYGIAIGNATMYGTFMGTCESNRHSITTGGDSDRGVSWGNKVTNFTGKAFSLAAIFDTHSSCGSIYFNNCIAIGGFNRNGATISGPFPNGFSIEGRTTHIVNCTVKDCYIAASSGNYNNIQEIYVKGLNCDDCTIGFSAVGTEVERLTLEDIDLWNSSLDENGICINLGGLSASFLNIKNIKSYNSACGINLSGNDLNGGQDGYLIENLVCYYSERWTTSPPSNFYSALRLYDSNNPISLLNCQTNAPRMITSNAGVTCSSLSIQNCRSFGSYETHILLAFPVTDLSIKDCNFSDTYVTGYPFFAAGPSLSNGNIENFTFTGNVLNGTNNLRGVYVDSSNTFNNFFDSGNTLNISTTPKRTISSNGKQPDYWITEGNIFNPLKINASLGATGSPEGLYDANVGTTFINNTGTTFSTFFIKINGSGSTGWTQSIHP